MGTLFLKECKIHIKSLLFIAYVLLLSLFFLTQFWDFPIVVEPKENASTYGWTTSNDKQVIMNTTMERLLIDFYNNEYATYPIGFYKAVKLNGKEINDIMELMEEAVGIPMEEIEAFYFNYEDKSPKSTGNYQIDSANIEKYKREHPFEVPFAENITYEIFENAMAGIDKILGGRSNYAKDNLKNNAYIPMTYEQAVEKYNSILKDDKVTGAYARLFCDYMGLMLGMLPVFLAVSRELRDKKSKVELVIYSKKLSSLRIMEIRYIAILAVSLLPVLVFGIILLAYALFQANSLGTSADILLYFIYFAAWLIPTTMFTISLGMLCSVLTGKTLGILVQAFIWIISIFSGNVRGQAGFNFIPRFNTFGSYSLFQDMYESFVINRVFYFILSLILFFVAVAVFEQKRKGGFSFHGNLSSN